MLALKVVVLVSTILGINFYAFTEHEDFVTWIVVQCVVTVGGLFYIFKTEE